MEKKKEEKKTKQMNQLKKRKFGLGFDFKKPYVKFVVIIAVLAVVLIVLVVGPLKITSLAIFNFNKPQNISYDCLKKIVSQYCINEGYTHYDMNIQYPIERKGYVLFRCSLNDEDGVKVQSYMVSLEKLGVDVYCDDSNKIVEEDIGGGAKIRVTS